MITLEIKNNIAWVTLNRPKKQNALNLSMFIELDKIIKDLKKDKTVRAVVLSGAGGHFCSGLDVKSVVNKPAAIFKLLFKWLPGSANLVQRVTLAWKDLPIPVIAVINGNCFGAGLHIALGADYRIAGPCAQLAIMEAKWGLCPDMGSGVLLPGLINQDILWRITSQAQPISASNAKEYGLISEIHTHTAGAVTALLDSLLLRSPDALAAIKKVNNCAYSANRRQVLSLETWSQLRLLINKNTRIAMQNAVKEEIKPYIPRSKW
ncbi:crotonase/enoyl-CoA hydratase family protein [Pseudoalteromonas sp. MMG013]|uniref:crotonase/enoyl-CoA hydratase family protein n=1 Tax=Pseudoalteromonas sp. MMG013 TaxID=2822687 RepID=UPI001B3721D2|nr:crotonase/enoyl-CoA hydratase family protein [Pseudoalteromonas sp. MMG013]MBQ4862592.1 crotonase/enoyl-CoA hydratase family protein [Pseudoalteromonas sp. MMG013]